MAIGRMHDAQRSQSYSYFRKLFCDHFDLYSEIHGPRQMVDVWDGQKRKGIMLDDGKSSCDGPMPRIFLPQHFRIQELHEQYPDATWILNLRPVEAWRRSVMKWDDLGWQFANEYYMQGVIEKLPANSTQLETFFLRTIHREHHDMVRSFVKDHPSDALVQLNITEDTAGDVLGNAFGLDPAAWTQSQGVPQPFLLAY